MDRAEKLRQLEAVLKSAIDECETEVASAEAVSREVYEETDGVVTIEKQSAKDVGEIKHIVIHSPNYTRYFYNESMPTSAEAVHKPDYSYEADMVKRLRQAVAVQGCDGCRYNTRIPLEQCLRCKRYWRDSYERKDGDSE